MEVVLTGGSIPYTVNALSLFDTMLNFVENLLENERDPRQDQCPDFSNLFSSVLNKNNLGNLGISVILPSALRVSGFGMNFLRVWVLFYCFCCYF
jgi:hypothetical protein